MRVGIVHSNAANCEPQCAEWIAADGDIVPDTVAAFRRVLNKLGKRNLPILLSSRGGSVYDGEAIGRLLRQRKMEVVIAKTDFDGCLPGEGWCKALKPADIYHGTPSFSMTGCASACVLILAGAVERHLGSTSAIGLHQQTSYMTQTRILRKFMIKYRMVNGVKTEISRELVSETPMSTRTFSVKTKKSSYDQTRDYYAEMGISGDIMSLIENTPSDSIHWMTTAEISKTKIGTDWSGSSAVLKKFAEAARLEAFTTDARGSELVGGATAGGQVDLEFKGGKGHVSLEFWPAPQRKEVQVLATPSVSGTVLSAPLTLILSTNSDTVYAKKKYDAPGQSTQLITALSLEAVCGLKSNPKIKLSLGEGVERASAAAAQEVDLSKMTGGSALMNNACLQKDKPVKVAAAPPQAQKPEAELVSPAAQASAMVNFDIDGQLTPILFTLRLNEAGDSLLARLVSDEPTEKRLITRKIEARFTAKDQTFDSQSGSSKKWAADLPAKALCFASGEDFIEISLVTPDKKSFVTQRISAAKIENYKALRDRLCRNFKASAGHLMPQ